MDFIAVREDLWTVDSFPAIETGLSQKNQQLRLKGGLYSKVTVQSIRIVPD